VSTRLNPYLNFRNNAREAMNFYQSVFGGKLDVSTFADFQSAEDPSENDLVMHSVLETPGGLTLMGADTPARMEFVIGTNSSVSLSGEDEAELKGYWDKLSEGANVAMPLSAAPWGDQFGMCTDRYGVSWLVNITAS
jgi:PhnB protein